MRAILTILTCNPILSIVFTLLLLTGTVSAQEVISSSGESYQNSSAQVAFSLGQLSIETYSSSSVIVTQGFHQTFEEIITGLAPVTDPITVSVYPNPTHDFLTIEAADFKDDINYQLYDLNGLTVNTGKFITSHDLSLRGYVDGIYLLILTNNREQLIQSFKIQVK